MKKKSKNCYANGGVVPTMPTMPSSVPAGRGVSGFPGRGRVGPTMPTMPSAVPAGRGLAGFPGKAQFKSGGMVARGSGCAIRGNKFNGS